MANSHGAPASGETDYVGQIILTNAHGWYWTSTMVDILCKMPLVIGASTPTSSPQQRVMEYLKMGLQPAIDSGYACRSSAPSPTPENSSIT